MRNQKTYELVLTALFCAIIIVMAFTPFGYIPLGVINATIIHVPVILGALFLGPKKGAFLGFVFGLTSMLKATFIGGTLSSFIFSPFLAASMDGGPGAIKSIIVCFVPRILVGIIPFYVYLFLAKVMKNRLGSKSLGFALAGISGALTNTILVMGGIFVLFRQSYATALNVPANTLFSVILGIVGTNGVAEAIVAGVITVAVSQILVKIKPVYSLG